MSMFFVGANSNHALILETFGVPTTASTNKLYMPTPCCQGAASLKVSNEEFTFHTGEFLTADGQAISVLCSASYSIDASSAKTILKAYKSFPVERRQVFRYPDKSYIPSEVSVEDGIRDIISKLVIDNVRGMSLGDLSSIDLIFIDSIFQEAKQDLRSHYINLISFKVIEFVRYTDAERAEEEEEELPAIEEEQINVEETAVVESGNPDFDFDLDANIEVNGDANAAEEEPEEDEEEYEIETTHYIMTIIPEEPKDEEEEGFVRLQRQITTTSEIILEHSQKIITTERWLGETVVTEKEVLSIKGEVPVEEEEEEMIEPEVEAEVEAGVEFDFESRGFQIDADPVEEDIIEPTVHSVVESGVEFDFGDEVDASADVNVDVDVDANVSAEIESPDVDVDAGKTRGSFRFGSLKKPNISMPKMPRLSFKGRGDADVSADAPTTNLDGAVSADVVDTDVTADVDLDADVSAGVEVDAPSAEVEVDAPSAEVEVNAGIDASAEVEAPEVDTGKTGGKFKFGMPHIGKPKFHMPKFGFKGSGGADVSADADVDAPSADLNGAVTADVVDVDIDVSADVDLDPSVSAEVEVDAPSAEVNVDAPSAEVEIDADINASADIETPEVETGKKGGKFRFGMPKIKKPHIGKPKFHMPKFGFKGSAGADTPIADLDGAVSADIVNVNPNVTGEVDFDKSVSADVEADTPSVEVDADVEVKTLAQLSADVDAPSGEVELDAGIDASADIEAPEVDTGKSGGFSIGMPKIGLPKFGFGGSGDADVSADAPTANLDGAVSADHVDTDLSADLDLDANVSAEVEVDAPSAELEVDAGIDASADVEAPEVDIDASANLEAPEVDAEKRGSFSFGMPKMKLPKFGFGGSGKADASVDAPTANLDGAVTADHIDTDVSADVDLDTSVSAEVEVDAPSAEVELDADIDASAELETPDIDGKKRGSFGFGLPKIGKPKFGLPKFGSRKGSADVSADVSVETPSVDVDTDVSAEVTADVDADVSADVEAKKPLFTVPIVTRDRAGSFNAKPKLDAAVTADVVAPTVDLDASVTADVVSPTADIDASVTADVVAPTLDLDGAVSADHVDTDVSPAIDLDASISADVVTPDAPAIDIDAEVPSAEAAVDADIDVDAGVSAEIETPEIDEKKRGSFSFGLPKFGRKDSADVSAEAPSVEIDTDASADVTPDVDADLSVDVDTPDVAASVEVKTDSPRGSFFGSLKKTIMGSDDEDDDKVTAEVSAETPSIQVDTDISAKVDDESPEQSTGLGINLDGAVSAEVISAETVEADVVAPEVDAGASVGGDISVGGEVEADAKISVGFSL